MLSTACRESGTGTRQRISPLSASIIATALLPLSRYSVTDNVFPSSDTEGLDSLPCLDMLTVFPEAVSKYLITELILWLHLLSGTASLQYILPSEPGLNFPSEEEKALSRLVLPSGVTFTSEAGSTIPDLTAYTSPFKALFLEYSVYRYGAFTICLYGMKGSLALISSAHIPAIVSAISL